MCILYALLWIDNMTIPAWQQQSMLGVACRGGQGSGGEEGADHEGEAEDMPAD